MTVDGLHPQNPGTIHRSVRTRVDNGDPARQNREAGYDIDIGKKTDRTGQEAFQVQISLQAQDRLTADAPDRAQDAKPQRALLSETTPVPRAGQGPGSGRIIDIVT